ncbi:hypothetical protein FA15DRAFT_673393 [Coprinopsis marcescibilis]|uniref:DUF6533 domain-containing protein n=1 Tax=Coprinopsis marcescibilis TaxID=230819 RepID=A0A5C3KKS6_COPMA|nr:hypothetical protein FA15DRAFT_673393 [Coprinopsis marcescibilis]
MVLRFDDGTLEEHLTSIPINASLPLACWVILMLEYFGTFSEEVEFIWPAKWGLVKILYFLDRFVPLLVLPLIVAYNITDRPTPDACRAFFAIPGVGLVLCIFLAEGLLYLRVVALSGRSKRMIAFIVANGVITMGACFALMARYILLATWDIERPAGFPGCKGVFPNGTIVMITYALTLYSGILVMALCIYYGFKKYWTNKPSHMIKIFYRDGTMYFIALTVMAISNLLIAANLPAKFRFLMTSFQTVMHSSLSIRMVLHLKKSARSEMGLGSTRAPAPFGPHNNSHSHTTTDYVQQRTVDVQLVDIQKTIDIHRSTAPPTPAFKKPVMYRQSLDP